MPGISVKVVKNDFDRLYKISAVVVIDFPVFIVPIPRRNLYYQYYLRLKFKFLRLLVLQAKIRPHLCHLEIHRFHLGDHFENHARARIINSQIADELKRKGVELQVIDQNINTSDATGRLLFNMLGAIAQFETEIRADRQLDGIDQAKQKGVKFGAQKKLTDEQIEEIKAKRANEVLIKTLMKDYKLSKASIYRYLKSS